jgi:GT2 family glycosyltransferase
VAPSASIVIPTRGRPRYLDVALASVVPQADALGAEVLVVCERSDTSSVAVGSAHGVRLVVRDEPTGANAARNAGVALASSELIVFLDDDVDAPAEWLAGLLAGVAAAPDHDVFGGPIVARLEGGGPRSCGREPAPITTLDCGARDCDVEFVWSANMAVRRRAFASVGPFDEALQGRGEEEDWQRRYAALGGRVRYVAAAGLVHTRNRHDSSLRALSRAGYFLGRTARRYDARKGSAVSLRRELWVLVGCIWHVFRRRCLNGVVMAAHSLGRAVESWAPVPILPPEDFLSGVSGNVSGVRRTGAAAFQDAVLDFVALARLQRARIAVDARRGPRRRVLVLAIERVDEPNLLAGARAELMRSRHSVECVSAPIGGRGKFENLNLLLESHPCGGFDWLLAVDDDVALPAGFLDRFVALCERFDLAVAQPAHRFGSHAAWAVTRRAPLSLVRETAFVEVGPVFAFRADAFDLLLPFPPLRAGWGLDAHWSAVARMNGLRLGVVDAVPIMHRLRPIAASYDRSDAIAEAREFLAGRPYVTRDEASRVLATHRSLRGR